MEVFGHSRASKKHSFVTPGIRSFPENSALLQCEVSLCLLISVKVFVILFYQKCHVLRLFQPAFCGGFLSTLVASQKLLFLKDINHEVTRVQTR